MSCFISYSDPGIIEAAFPISLKGCDMPLKRSWAFMLPLANNHGCSLLNTSE